MNEVSKLIDRTITSVEFDDTITSIGRSAFNSCSSLTSVTIPSWITSINSYAFSGCSSLTSVTCLATTPPTLGSGVFGGSSCPIYVPVDRVSAYKAATNWSSYSSRIQGIPFLKAVYTDVNDVEHEVWGGTRTLARSEWGTDYGNVLVNMESCEVKTGVTTIGSNCFYAGFANDTLTSITLPDTVTTIRNNAFQNCTGLTDLNIPSGVTTIDSYAFDGCAKLATDLSFIDGTGVTRLNNYVFAEMLYNDNGTYKGLTTANIPEGITTINDNAFYHSFCITSISIPSTVTSISSYALKTSYDYDNLVSMTVDANNATYDSRNNCNAVIHTSTNTLVAGCKTTVIPNTVTSIGSMAFRDVFLSSITIPDSVTSIGTTAFHTPTLRNVTVQSTVPATVDSTAFNKTYLSTIIVPAGTLSAYETAWSDYKDFLFENGVAKWVEQSYTCEVDANDTKTGMITVTEKDTNPTSSTYNTTRQRTYEDLTRCNPIQGFIKITSLSDATSGTYLVVDEGRNHALNASLIKTTTSTNTGLNSSTNYIDVTITNDVIEADSTTLSAALEYDSTYQSLTWTDPDKTTTYTIAHSGNGTSFAISGGGNNNQTVASEVNGMFTFRSDSGTVKYIGNYNSASKFTWRSSSQVTGNIALYKLN